MQTLTTACIHQGKSNIYFWPSLHVANRLVSMPSLYRDHHVLLRKFRLWLIIKRCLTIRDHDPRETVHVDKLSSDLLSMTKTETLVRDCVCKLIKEILLSFNSSALKGIWWTFSQSVRHFRNNTNEKTISNQGRDIDDTNMLRNR